MKHNRINFKNEDNSKLFFTSDLHFGHSLMQKIRKFESIYKMDNALINNWNQTVPEENAKVFALGDFSWYSKEKTRNIFEQLNGDIYFIRGNHDEIFTDDFVKSIPKIKDIKTYAELILEVKGEIYETVLSHFPFEIWDRKHYGSLHFHGHCHGNLLFNDQIRRIDVGVDNHSEMRPYTFAELAEIMSTVDLNTLTK